MKYGRKWFPRPMWIFLVLHIALVLVLWVGTGCSIWVLYDMVNHKLWHTDDLIIAGYYISNLVTAGMLVLLPGAGLLAIWCALLFRRRNFQTVFMVHSCLVVLFLLRLALFKFYPPFLYILFDITIRWRFFLAMLAMAVAYATGVVYVLRSKKLRVFRTPLGPE